MAANDNHDEDDSPFDTSTYQGQMAALLHASFEQLTVDEKLDALHIMMLKVSLGV